MNISDVEAKTSLTRRMIRHYEDLGLLSPQRSENGYREYTDKDVEDLLCIKSMREVGFSLNEISSILKDGKTEETLRQHLRNLLISQQEEFSKQQSRLQIIKSALKSDDVTSRLFDRIGQAQAPAIQFEGVDDLDCFLRKRHVVRGHVKPLEDLKTTAVFGSQLEFKVVNTSYSKYGTVIQQNELDRASISLCKELYAYVILFTENGTEYGPEFHKTILNQFSEQWAKHCAPLSLHFDAMTDEPESLNRIFSSFDLAATIVAEDSQGHQISLVLPAQPLVVYVNQKSGTEFDGHWMQE
ncbi:MerR family transcriptional regulator [Bdellovibrio sp. HCB290]|uniref:MerR family transcriptional regulator n=1 Tax=Bdellovibrio sp. HCB290 TaxID=3394356 RepID=UPI0039B56AEE